MRRHGLEFQSKGAETFDMFRAEYIVSEHLRLFAGGDEDLAEVLAALMPDSGIEHLTAIVSEDFVSQMASGLNEVRAQGLDDFARQRVDTVAM